MRTGIRAFNSFSWDIVVLFGKEKKTHTNEKANILFVFSHSKMDDF